MKTEALLAAAGDEIERRDHAILDLNNVIRNLTDILDKRSKKIKKSKLKLRKK